MWLQGYQNAPNLIKVCHESCLKYLDREITMIDINNIQNYIDIPDYILENIKITKLFRRIF